MKNLVPFFREGEMQIEKKKEKLGTGRSREREIFFFFFLFLFGERGILVGERDNISFSLILSTFQNYLAVSVKFVIDLVARKLIYKFFTRVLCARKSHIILSVHLCRAI